MADLNIGNSSANVLVNAKYNGSVIPQINNTYDLGTSALRWKNIYSNLKGNADTATKLTTARTISLTGSVTGSGTFDGSGNLNITTTTNHTHNYAGSSSAGGAATSANKLSSARTIGLGTGVTSTATSFDGSSNITIPVTSIKESYLSWGGKNFAGDYGCIDAAMVSDLGANRLMFGKAAGITIQYSTDGGNNWTDYGASNSEKVGLFSSGHGFRIGKATKDTITANCMLRVIINTDNFGVYTQLNKFVIYLSTEGCNGCYCTIDASLESSPTIFTTFANKVPVSGWSGYNVINTSYITTYGNSPSNQYGLIRFTFGCTSVNTNYPGLNIIQIMGFGGVGWVTPSTMAKTGHLYSYDSSQNAAFPATVTAPRFNGALSGNASTATKLQTARTISLIGSITGSGTFDGSGNLSIATTTNHTHNYAGSSSAGGPANSVKTNLIIKLNGGTNEGNNLFTFNGSAAKTINITPAAIGASASGHTHDDRYYGKSEIDGMLEGKAEIEHNHDAYYYRKEEIDEALVAPDWNQNDETAHNYIKNRPFYTDGPVETVLLDNVSVTIEDDGYGIIETQIAFTEGDTYKVEWNGTAYECVAYIPEAEAPVVIGNGAIFDSNGGNGEPFIMYSTGRALSLSSSQEPGTYTVSIAEKKGGIHEIDKKYLGYEVITTTLFDGTVLIGAQ